MKKTLLVLSCLTALSAYATTYPPVSTPPTATAQAGAIAGAAAMSSSRSRSASTSAGGAATITGAMGVSGGTFGGNGGKVGNLTAGGLDLAGARIGSDVSVAASAPSLYGATPTQPTQPCARPGFSIGGSSKDGSGLLSIPTGTDVTCRVDNALTIMGRNPALFTAEDRLRVSCKQEDIAETTTCKDLAKRDAEKQRVTSILDGRPTVSASLGLLP